MVVRNVTVDGPEGVQENTRCQKECSLQGITYIITHVNYAGRRSPDMCVCVGVTNKIFKNPDILDNTHFHGRGI